MPACTEHSLKARWLLGCTEGMAEKSPERCHCLPPFHLVQKKKRFVLFPCDAAGWTGFTTSF